MLRVRILFLMLFMIVAFAGCTPDQIEAVKAQAEYQLTDPGSQTQQAAEAIGTAAEYAKPAAALFPGAPWILAGLTVISGLCNLMQKLTTGKRDKAIKELVAGGEAFKTAVRSGDNPGAENIIDEFKTAQGVAQSTDTKLIVAAERVKAA